jgi:hypothetical protein
MTAIIVVAAAFALVGVMVSRRNPHPEEWRPHFAIFPVLSTNGEMIGGNIMRRKIRGVPLYREMTADEAYEQLSDHAI